MNLKQRLALGIGIVALVLLMRSPPHTIDGYPIPWPNTPRMMYWPNPNPAIAMDWPRLAPVVGMIGVVTAVLVLALRTRTRRDEEVDERGLQS